MKEKGACVAYALIVNKSQRPEDGEADVGFVLTVGGMRCVMCV